MKINLKGIRFEWSVKSKDWKVLGQKGPALFVRPGKGQTEIGVKIHFPSGLALDVFGKFESFKPDNYKLENPSQSTLGVTGDEIKVFPNPTRSEITIQLPDDMDGQQVQILTHLGELVRKNKTKSNTMKISVVDLTPGVYVVQLSDGESVVVKRFIKM